MLGMGAFIEEEADIYPHLRITGQLKDKDVVNQNILHGLEATQSWPLAD